MVLRPLSGRIAGVLAGLLFCAVGQVNRSYLAAEAYLSDDAEQSRPEQNAALRELNDEIMSMLHAQQLRQVSVPSATVKEWLEGLTILRRLAWESRVTSDATIRMTREQRDNQPLEWTGPAERSP